MSRPLSDLPKAAAALANAIENGQKASVEDAALNVKEEMLSGPERSGLSRRSKLGGRRWGVRYKLEQGRNGQWSAFVRYFGPIQWIERGTKRHYVVPKAFGSRRRRAELAAAGRLPGVATGRGAKALRLPDGGIRRSVPHPGTKGRPFWKRTKHRSRKTAARTISTSMRRNILRASRGKR